MPAVICPEPAAVLIDDGSKSCESDGFSAKEKDACKGRPFWFEGVEPDFQRRNFPEADLENQISRMTGMINGRRLVLFWMYRFRSLRIFSLMTP
jgi:hypothetical protein